MTDKDADQKVVDMNQKIEDERPREWKFIGLHWDGDCARPIFHGQPIADDAKFDVIEKSAYDDLKAEAQQHFDNYQDLGKLHREEMNKLEAEIDTLKSQLAEALKDHKQALAAAKEYKAQAEELKADIKKASDVIKNLEEVGMSDESEIERLRYIIDVKDEYINAILEGICSADKGKA